MHVHERLPRRLAEVLGGPEVKGEARHAIDCATEQRGEARRPRTLQPTHKEKPPRETARELPNRTRISTCAHPCATLVGTIDSVRTLVPLHLQLHELAPPALALPLSRMENDGAAQPPFIATAPRIRVQPRLESSGWLVAVGDHMAVEDTSLDDEAVVVGHG